MRRPIPVPTDTMRNPLRNLSFTLFLFAGTASAQDTADAAFQAQDWPRAESLYRSVLKADEKNGQAWYRLGYALHAQGKYAKAIPIHEKAATFPSVRVNASYNAGCAYALTDDKDKAFAWLQKARAAGFKNASHLKTDSDLVSLRGDARFQKLLAELGPVKLRKYDAATNEPMASSEAFAVLPQAKAFHFMGSRWKIRNTFHGPRGSVQTDASNHGKSHLDGKVIIDHYSGKYWNGTQIDGITIRAFDEKQGTWSIVWLDNRQAPRFSPLIGKFVNGIGAFYPKGTTEKTAKTRFRWDNIGKDRARWMQQTKTETDQGTKWMATWVMDFSRG
jgi:Tetratricopeptide repeat